MTGMGQGQMKQRENLEKTVYFGDWYVRETKQNLIIQYMQYARLKYTVTTTAYNTHYDANVIDTGYD